MTINWELRRRRLSEWRKQQAKIARFVRELDHPAADPYEMQKRQHELGITNEMIDAHRAKRNAEVTW